MIKKLMIAALAVVMVIAGTACTNEAEETATANAEAFMTAVCEGDFETAKTYCTEDAYKETGLGELENISSRVCKALGTKKSKLSKKAQESLDQLGDMLKNDFAVSYEITEVEESKTGVVVKATVTYGFDFLEFEKVKVSDKEIDKITDGYLEKHQEKLLEVYKEKGEDAMMNKIMSDLIPKFIDKYSEKIKALGTHSETVQLTIDKKKGKYIITDVASEGIEKAKKLEEAAKKAEEQAEADGEAETAEN